MILEKTDGKDRKMTAVEIVFLVYLFVTYAVSTHIAIFRFYRTATDYVSLLFLGLIVLVGKFRCLTLRNIIYFAGLSVVTTLCILVNHGGIGSVVTILMPFLLLFSLSEITLSEKTKRIMLVFAACFLVFALVRSVCYTMDWRQHTNFDVNPNTYAMYIMFSYSITAVFLNRDGRRNRAFYWSVFLIALVSMLLFRARICIIVLLLIFFADRLCEKISPKMILFGFCALMLIGIAFPPIYVAISKLLPQMRILNKPLFSGRQRIWGDMLSAFGTDPLKWLLGMGSYSDAHGFNMHNNFYAVLVNFGIVGFAAYYGYFLFHTRKILAKTASTEAKKCLMIFACTVFGLGCTEITSLWSVMFPFTYLFFAVPLNELRRTEVGESDT